MERNDPLYRSLPSSISHLPGVPLILILILALVLLLALLLFRS